MEIIEEYIKIMYNYFLKLQNGWYCNCSEKKIKRALSKWYRKKTDHILNLDDPKSFNEKIQWMKLYDSTIQKANLTDKYLVREWVSKKIGKEYLIPLLGVWDSYKDIEFDKLPDKFVLKTNNASGTNLIVNDKQSINHKLCSLKINRWLNSNFAFKSGFELHYGLIQPKVICEQHMGNNVKDYKFFCIHGRPQFIWVDSDRFIKHKRKVYDLDWKEASFYIGDFEKIDTNDDDKLKPKNFLKMVELAEILSKEFCFVRVDFYEIDGQIYFGEMTFTPSSGTEQFSPQDYDYYFGNMICLPEPKELLLKRIAEQHSEI